VGVTKQPPQYFTGFVILPAQESAVPNKPCSSAGTTSSLARDNPWHSNMHGTLDSSGKASATFTLPAGINPALIGNTYHFAAIANQVGFLPKYSSIAIPVVITQ